MKYLLNKFDKVTIHDAKGAYLYGKQKYIDTCLGCGTHILGHQPIELKDTLYGTANSLLEEWETLIRSFLPFFDNFVLCNTGSEATMRAVRIARAFTGKKKIGIFHGGWHGSSDWSLDCAGIPREVKDLIVWLPYNDTKCFDLIKKHRKELAMVLIEPVQGSNPQNINGFLHHLRWITKECSVILGFDEVITGFRLAKGGGAEYFEVTPDIATYGKVLGGGLPIGMVAGKSEIMSVINRKDVFMGGTFSGNPATIQASLGLLKELNNSVYMDINSKGVLLRGSISRKGMSIIGVGSISRVIFTERKIKNRCDRDKHENPKLRERFFNSALESGVYVGSNGIQFLSTAHTQEDINKIIEAFNNI